MVKDKNEKEGSGCFVVLTIVSIPVFGWFTWMVYSNGRGVIFAIFVGLMMAGNVWILAQVVHNAFTPDAGPRRGTYLDRLSDDHAWQEHGDLNNDRDW